MATTFIFPNSGKEKSYTINTECGLMEVPADTLEEAKAIYSEARDFDFASVTDCEGSWYWIEDQDGNRLEQETDSMP